MSAAPPIDLLDAQTPHSARQQFVGREFALTEAQSARLHGETSLPACMATPSRNWLTTRDIGQSASASGGTSRQNLPPALDAAATRAAEPRGGRQGARGLA